MIKFLYTMEIDMKLLKENNKIHEISPSVYTDTGYSNDSNKQNINYTFKFLYAIGIIIIVSGHCKTGGGINLFYDWFTPYAFNLALFTFCSGYFYKDINERNVKKYILKKVKKLIIPMYIWNIAYAIFDQIIKLKGFQFGNSINLKSIVIDPLINGHQFAFTLALWYVVPLFCIEIINILVRKIINILKIQKNEYIFFIVSLLFGLIGTYFSNKGYNKNLYLFLNRIFYLLQFFYFGILYNRKLEKHDKMNNLAYFFIIFAIQLAVITKYGHTVAVTPSWCNFKNTKLLITPFLIGFIGILFWLRVARIMEPITKNCKIINCIANHTYSIMVHHFFAFFIIKTIYAVLSKIMPCFKDFNWISYKLKFGYYYLPKGINQYYIIYLIAGIIIPILIEEMLNKIKEIIKNSLFVMNGKLEKF